MQIGLRYLAGMATVLALTLAGWGGDGKNGSDG